MRARLLAADLVTFDPGRLGWVLAVRTSLGLALPLLLAHALDQPSLVWVGLGAYLLAIGDCVDNGDRAQPMRIAVGAALGGLALATGVLAGGTLVTALAWMAAWGVVTGMMSVYGNAFAAMSLPIAWAYVELGLPAADHTLPTALLTGGLFVLGGLLTLLLTLTLRRRRRVGLDLSLAADDERLVVAASLGTPKPRWSAALSPLLANLDPNSVAARHALRFAVVTSVAVAVFWVFPKPFGYWVPLTATVVLKPYAGMTLARAVQRAIGTAVGILAGLALMPFLPTLSLQFSAAIICFFAMMAVLPFNYALAIVFLSAGIIPFEHVLTPDIRNAVGTDRLTATAIGVALALIGGHVLWPTFERQGLPGLLRSCKQALAAYADAVIGTAQGDVATGEMQAGRRGACLALTNLEAGVQRSLTEFGGDTVAMIPTLRAAAALRRLGNGLDALLQTAPIFARSRPALAAFRASFVSALSDPGRGKPSIDTLRSQILLPDNSAEAAAFRQLLDRLVSELEMLLTAASTCPPTISTRPSDEIRSQLRAAHDTAPRG